MLIASRRCLGSPHRCRVQRVASSVNPKVHHLWDSSKFAILVDPHSKSSFPPPPSPPCDSIKLLLHHPHRQKAPRRQLRCVALRTSLLPSSICPVVRVISSAPTCCSLPTPLHATLIIVPCCRSSTSSSSCHLGCRSLPEVQHGVESEAGAIHDDEPLGHEQPHDLRWKRGIGGAATMAGDKEEKKRTKQRIKKKGQKGHFDKQKMTSFQRLTATSSNGVDSNAK